MVKYKLAYLEVTHVVESRRRPVEPQHYRRRRSRGQPQPQGHPHPGNHSQVRKHQQAELQV